VRTPLQQLVLRLTGAALVEAGGDVHVAKETDAGHQLAAVPIVTQHAKCWRGLTVKAPKADCLAHAQSATDAILVLWMAYRTAVCPQPAHI